MSVKILHVLCEGQTEQGFVENVLKPYLLSDLLHWLLLMVMQL